MTTETKDRAPSLTNRMQGAIWGQFVGDAACLGSHWIYDLDQLTRRFRGEVTGFETPQEGHYHAGKHSGDLTHYGDAALLMLHSVAHTGEFSPSDFGERFVALFSSEDYKGYRDHATNGTLDNYQSYVALHQGVPYPFRGGADDDQPATVTRLVPVVVAHYLDPTLLHRVEQATLVCQNHPRAIAYAKCHSLVLRELFSGAEVAAAFRSAAHDMESEGRIGAEVSGSIQEAFAALDLTVREATLRFGQACPLSSSFPAAVHCALKHTADVQRAILDTANAGGDNAARAALVGAWLGAANGVEGIAKEWRNRVNAHQEIERDMNKVIEKRSHRE